ncbi:hypothetical protein OGAPHI_000762 [Ogataea philodendri]|uniref:Translation machinery-associated protein 16 n=1 Tax=Ogataea philodendri TaxID=1378263 RepID=A0A9P8PFN2_9ASCO|nr:uncharacterized protein OGAPHI_000762 [Ogataea philodendri]KAH3671051.1 hypothetical protein OGAPHI_000762 [Ogataea philodendri]
MAKSLTSVTRKLKPSKLLHPKGRKARLVSRATLRDEKLAKKKAIHQDRKSEELQIVTYFQQVICDNEEWSGKPTFEPSEIHAFIQTFIARDDDELEQLRAERRPGRPATKRQDLLEQRKAKESHMYETGWSIPDLQNKTTVELLRNWNGDRGSLTALTFKTVKKSDL